MKLYLPVVLIILTIFSSDVYAQLPFSDDFESGDTSNWTSEVPREANMQGCIFAVTMSAALSGNFGLNASLCINTAYVQDSNPNNETSYRAIFDFNPNSVNIMDGNEVTVFQARATTTAFEVRLAKNGANLEIRAYGYDNAGMESGFTFIALPDLNTHTIGVNFKTASSDGADNGKLFLELDNNLVMDSLLTLDNDLIAINSARLGIIASNGETGSVYFDNFVSDVNALPVTLMNFEID